MGTLWSVRLELASVGWGVGRVPQALRPTESSPWGTLGHRVSVWGMGAEGFHVDGNLLAIPASAFLVLL